MLIMLICRWKSVLNSYGSLRDWQTGRSRWDSQRRFSVKARKEKQTLRSVSFVWTDLTQPAARDSVFIVQLNHSTAGKGAAYVDDNGGNAQLPLLDHSTFLIDRTRT